MFNWRKLLSHIYDLWRIVLISWLGRGSTIIFIWITLPGTLLLKIANPLRSLLDLIGFPPLFIISIIILPMSSNLMPSLEPRILLIFFKNSFSSLYLALRFDTLKLLLKFTARFLLLGSSLMAYVTDGLPCSDCRTIFLVKLSALGHRTPISVILEDHFVDVAIRHANTIHVRRGVMMWP